MRTFIIEINEYAKKQNPGFLIIPQNGTELITHNGKANGILYQNYASSIDAIGREDLFFGYPTDNFPTNENERDALIELCKLYYSWGIEVLTIDYCWSEQYVDQTYALNHQNNFISFAASKRELNEIPPYPEKPFNENSNDISSTNEIKNFLYLINSEKFSTKKDFIDTLITTNYDLIIIDLFHFGEKYNQDEIERLKIKKNGGKRLVICYMSIGEAEDYRYYWEAGWTVSKPDWILEENPEWEGNYKVEYWNEDWKSIIMGEQNSYLGQIIDCGFDGVYLDLVDAFGYFEE